MGTKQDDPEPETSPPAYEDGAAPPLIADAEELPPIYRTYKPLDPDEVLPPCTLVMRRRFIYGPKSASSPSPAHSEPAASSTGPSKPANTTGEEEVVLYQLSRVINVNHRNTFPIDFQRLEYRTPPLTNTTPNTTTTTTTTKGTTAAPDEDTPPSPPPTSLPRPRVKDLYTMQYRASDILPVKIPPKLVPTALRKHTLGNDVQIQTTKLFGGGPYRAVKLGGSGPDRKSEEGGGSLRGQLYPQWPPPKLAPDEYWFDIKWKDGGWEWRDEGGKRVVGRQSLVRSGEEGVGKKGKGGEGVEGQGGGGGGGSGSAEVEREGEEEEGDGTEYKLCVEVPLPRRVRDGLVALWCMFIWQKHCEQNTPKKTWEDRKRILQQPHRGPYLWGTFTT